MVRQAPAQGGECWLPVDATSRERQRQNRAIVLRSLVVEYMIVIEMKKVQVSKSCVLLETTARTIQRGE